MSELISLLCPSVGGTFESVLAHIQGHSVGVVVEEHQHAWRGAAAEALPARSRL